VQLFSTYASTEKQTAFTECTKHNGSHAHSELIIFEILDDNNKPLKPGEYGELTITTLGIEGMPLLRYKTGDICTYYDEPCACGTNSYRLSQIVGRKKQLIKLKGTTLYPSTIFNTLNSIQEIEDYFVEVKTNDIHTDDVHVYISLKETSKNLQQNLIKTIQTSLRVLPEISFLSNEEVLHLQAKISNRKLNKFHDNRKP
jgi:phenylacetate-CoA ligase